MAHPSSVFGDPAGPTGRKQAVGGGGPGLFDQLLPGLFGKQQAALQLGGSIRDRLTRKIFPGLFEPSKKEQALIDQEDQLAEAMATQRAKSIAGELRVSGRGDVLQFQNVRDTVRLAALGDEQARASLQSLLAAETTAQRKARQGKELTTAEQAEENLRSIKQANDAAELAAAGGNFGSFLSATDFRDINEKVGAQMSGASGLLGIADVIEELTDAQIVAFGAGAGGELQGQIEGKLFALMRPLQTLLEQGKGSVLRESDAKLIRAVTGDPASFWQLVFSREEKVLSRLRTLAEELQEQVRISTAPLDALTMQLLEPVNQIRVSPFRRPEGKDDTPSLLDTDFFKDVELFPGGAETTEKIREALPSVADLAAGVLKRFRP